MWLSFLFNNFDMKPYGYCYLHKWINELMMFYLCLVGFCNESMVQFCNLCLLLNWFKFSELITYILSSYWYFRLFCSDVYCTSKFILDVSNKFWIHIICWNIIKHYIFIFYCEFWLFIVPVAATIIVRNIFLCNI